MSEQELLYELKDGVATLTLNRPEVLNALNGALRVALHEAIERVADDPAARCLVITGAGRGFCAGADINEMEAGPQTPRDMSHLRAHDYPALLRLLTMEKPVVAAVNGVAAGAGCGLALAADFVIAAESARFHFPFLRLGLLPDWGLHYTLPRLVGLARAREIFISMQPVDASEALRLGMVNRIVPDVELGQQVAAMARDLAAAPPLALGLSKRLLNQTFDQGLYAALEAEIEGQERCAASAEHREAVQDFRAKRPARFGGVRLP
jgi:2-(1,2-epoxy-1,2-dihydrophenyl)acetyl-CoA isomerase